MSTSTEPVVTVRQVSKRYGEGDRSVLALDAVDLAVQRGEVTAIMGPSGSGKSTLMQVMAALDEPTSGSITIDGREITGLDDDARTVLRRRALGFVFQAFNLVPTLDVLGNIRLPFELDDTEPDPETVLWIDHLLGELGIAALRTRRPYELSGGQQQRVAIARALARRPAVLFADEPTGALDSRTSRQVLELLSSAAENHGQTVVLVTHDPLAAAAADRVVFLADGTIVDDIRGASADELAGLSLTIERRA